MAHFEAVLEQIQRGKTIQQVVHGEFKGNWRAFYGAFSQQQLSQLKEARRQHPYHASRGRRSDDTAYMLLRTQRQRLEKLADHCNRKGTTMTKFVNSLIASALEAGNSGC